MGRGRKPIKRQLLSLNPNPRPSTVNPSPVEYSVDDPLMPEWLDEIGRKKWHELLSGLKPMSILSPVDADAVAVYCSLYSQVVRCQQMIDRSGGFIEQEGRPLKSHPAVDQLTALSARLSTLGKSLGLTPLARSKLVADPVRKEQNWLEELCGVKSRDPLEELDDDEEDEEE